MSKKGMSKKEIAAKSAAMFEVTSIPTDNLSAMPDVNAKISAEVKRAEEEEIEKLHEEEAAEAKMLGIEDAVIVESTSNEISKDFEAKLEEAQARYLEAVDDKNKYAEENKKLKSKNEELLSAINDISSSFDCYKIDASRDIANYQVEIQDLQEKISIYEHNEENYKIEISNLRTKFASLEQQIEEYKKNLESKAAYAAAKLRAVMPGPIAQTKPVQSNGYVSWN